MNESTLTDKSQNYRDILLQHSGSITISYGLCGPFDSRRRWSYLHHAKRHSVHAVLWHSIRANILRR